MNKRVNSIDEPSLIREMGPELGRAFFKFHKEILFLHVKWNTFFSLFTDHPVSRLPLSITEPNKKRQRIIDLLNETAGSYFALTQEMMWQDIYLHIAKLTDPPNSRFPASLTIKFITEKIIAQKQNAAIENEIKILLDDLEQKREFAKIWRNKVIAHLDYEVANKSKTLVPGTRENIETVLEAFRKIMDLLFSYYSFQHYAYDAAELHRSSGVRPLIRILSKGLKNEKEQ